MSEVLEVREGTETYAKAAARVEEVIRTSSASHELVQSFEILAEAQGGLERLRGLVLDLAIRGRLSDQRPSDESAEALLRRVRAAQEIAQERGEIDSPRELRASGQDELPHDLPSGWAWSRLCGAVLTIQIGPFGSLLHQSDYVPGGTPLVNPTNIRDGKIEGDPKKGVEPKTLARLRGYRLKAGDIVMGRRGEMGKCAVVTAAEDGWLCGTGSLFIRPTDDVLSAFIAIWLRSPSVRATLAGESVGSTMNNLNLRILTGIVLAVPPLAEQKRIVAKVDQLTALCDELEARQTKKRAVGARLTKSALEALTSAEGPEEFEAAWARVIENFDVLLQQPQSVPPLRRALLDLVAEGQLGGDIDPVSDSVPDLVCSERAGLVRQGVSRERPVQLPDRTRGWQLVPLELLLAAPLANGRSVPDGDGFPVLRLSALRGRFVDFDEAKSGAWSAHEARQFVAEKGDLLVVRGNGAMRLVGRACIVGDAPQPTAFPDTAIRVRPNPRLVDTSWLWYCWETSKTREQIERRAKTTAGIFKVSQDDLSSLVMPVPPLHVQEQLVQMLDRFFKQCDELEAGFRMVEERAEIVSRVLSDSLAS